MQIKLRKTEKKDIDFVLEAERHSENSQFIGQWDRVQHLFSLEDQNIGHFILERMSDGKSVGYIIVAGFAGGDESIEFRRLVVTEKGNGYGKDALQLVKQTAFHEWKAHRLWLDVRSHNKRAINLYKTSGFVEEGLLRDCVKVDDHFESLIVLSVLKPEYLNTHSSVSN